ncbi:MAG: ArsC/Spx/MgsR family protein, partial [Rhodoferax sp.]
KIVHYMEGEPITVSQLSTLLKKLEMPARSLLRKKAQTYNEFNLDDTKLTDGEIINLMVEHPELISRPIVMSSKGIKLCRPADTVLSLL